MKIKFKCKNCNAQYQGDDANIPKQDLTIRCKKCGAKIFIRKKVSNENDKKVTIFCPKCSQKQSAAKTCFFCGAPTGYSPSQKEMQVKPKADTKTDNTKKVDLTKLCPNCAESQPKYQKKCTGCGFDFSKSMKSKQSKKPIIDEDTPFLTSDNNITIPDLTAWINEKTLFYSILLLVGFIWPLFKKNMLFDSTKIIWPWTLILPVKDVEVAVSTSTFSASSNFIIWVLLPLIAGVSALCFRKFAKLKIHIISTISIGAATLILLQLFLYKQSEIFGLIFVPPTFFAGLFEIIFILSAAAIAITNHLRKSFDNNKWLRRLSGAGGIIAALLTLLGLFGISDEWKSWAIIILFLSLFVYAAMAIISALQELPDDTFYSKLSITVRIILGWLPFAILVTQNSTNDSFVTYVMGAGGGFFHTLMSVIKCFCIYYGCAFMMASGIASLLEHNLIRNQESA